MTQERLFDKYGRVGVLMGGVSSEREISLKSGKAIYEALSDSGVNAVALDVQTQETDKIKAFIQEAQIDSAFIALHGTFGEDGQIQSLLEQMDILYTGSGVKASQMAINKVAAQECFKQHNMSVPRNFHLGQADGQVEWESAIESLGGYPVVVKPALEGSSIGVHIVDDAVSFREAVADAGKYGDQILVEQYIQGREFTVSLLDRKPLPVIEICPPEHFFDFDSKYSSAKTRYIVPAKISPILAATLQSIALKAYRLLGCADFGRVDLMVDKDLNHYVLEVNTIPGFTASSLLPKAAAETGLSFNQLCLKILEIAYGTKKEKKDQSFNI